MKTLLKPLFFGFLCLFFIAKTQAQKTDLKIQINDSIQNQLFKLIPYKERHLTKESALLEIEVFSEKLSRNGFLNYSYSIIDNDSLLISTFNLGLKTATVHIKYDSNILKIDFFKNFSHPYNNDYFEIPINKVEQTLNLITKHFETKGDSFVEVSLKDVEFNDSLLKANLQINQSQKRIISKIIIKGYDEFPEKFYKNHFKFKPNSTFNLSKVQQLSNLLQKIPFVNEIKPPEVLFAKDSTIIYLYAKKKSQNKFNGLIGFSNDATNNKLVFTGNLDIALSNMFNKGEEITINWKSNVNDHKSFNVSFFTPYLYNTKFSPKATFSISKHDSSYVNVKTNLKLNYSINRTNSINALFKKENSNISSINTNLNVQDFKKTLAGISYSHQSNLKNTFQLEFGTLIGNRKTTTNTTQQTNLELLAEYHLFLNQKSTILIKQQNEVLISNAILENELFRIGGATSIRGFDELAISVSSYSITNLEYHFKLNQTSAVYSITDFGFIDNKLANLKSNLYSFGIGYYFENEKSSTNLGYAVGKTSETPLKLNNSKIHLKITYYF